MRKPDGRALGKRVAVTEPPPRAADGVPDYADAFGIARPKGDKRTAEQWAREGFDGLPLTSRKGGMLAHRHMLGFRLGPWSSPQHIFGWHIASSQPEVLHLEARGPLLTGHMVWRLQDERMLMTTFVHYNQGAVSALVWAVAQHIHRNAVPGLLRLAARAGAP